MVKESYSVLMSVYMKEEPKFLETSINSMLNQTVKPEQIILVKDGPLTKELDDIIEEYISHDTEAIFTIVPLKENQGLGIALNEGMKHARNELVARMDTDDISKPHRCERQLDVFEKNPELSIVGSVIDEFMNDPSQVNSRRVVPEYHDDIVKFSKRRNPFNHPTIMYKKSKVIEDGGYGNFRRNQDYDLFVRMLKNGAKAYNIQESLLFFRADTANLHRRKTWNKTKGDIMIRYRFFKEGYSSLFDLLISSTAFLISFAAPAWLFEKFTKTFLRKK